MPKTGQIIQYTNDELKKNAFSDQRFNGSKFHGLSVLIKRKNVTEPCIFTQNGGAEYCGKDDRAPLVIYHRSIGAAYKTDSTKGFGDEVLQIRAVKVSLILTALRKKIRMSAEELEMHVSKFLPEGIPKLMISEFGIKRCSIYKIACDYNTPALHQREYSQPYSDPDLIIIELQYGIECAYENKCINTLCCD